MPATQQRPWGGFAAHGRQGNAGFEDYSGRAASRDQDGTSVGKKGTCGSLCTRVRGEMATHGSRLDPCLRLDFA